MRKSSEVEYIQPYIFLCDLFSFKFVCYKYINMKVNITPLTDRIVIKPEDSEQTTASGIIIETTKDKLHRGTVVAVGAGKPNEPITVKVGDTVLYAKHISIPLELEGNDYVIIREADILAIL